VYTSFTQETQLDTVVGSQEGGASSHFAQLAAAAAPLLAALGADVDAVIAEVVDDAGRGGFPPLALAERWALLDDAVVAGAVVGGRGGGAAATVARAEAVAAGAAARPGARLSHLLLALRAGALRRRLCAGGGAGAGEGGDGAWARLCAAALAPPAAPLAGGGGAPAATGAEALLPALLTAAALNFIDAHTAGLPALRRRAFEFAVSRAVATAVGARAASGGKRRRSESTSPPPLRAAPAAAPLLGEPSGSPPPSALSWGAGSGGWQGACSRVLGCGASGGCSPAGMQPSLGGAASQSGGRISAGAQPSPLGASAVALPLLLRGASDAGTGYGGPSGADAAPMLPHAAPPPSPDAPMNVAELAACRPRRARRSSLRRADAPARNLRVSLPPEYLTSPEGCGEEGDGGRRAESGAGAGGARVAPRRRPLTVLAASQMPPPSAQRPGGKPTAPLLQPAAGAKKRGRGLAGWLEGAPR
jgi:hypothetical protein